MKLKRHVKESVQWARLEDVGDRNMGDFIDSLQDKTVTPDPLYLFDWNLPFYCPDLVQELIIPKYFAGLFKDIHCVNIFLSVKQIHLLTLCQLGNYTQCKLCLWWVYCFHVVHPSVTFCFLNILKSHCWIFIKPCKHVHICKANT